MLQKAEHGGVQADREPAGTLIELRSISKNFGSYQAVDDVSMSIGHGEFVTLLGASGSGKTTTLRLIAGLDMPRVYEAPRSRAVAEFVGSANVLEGTVEGVTAETVSVRFRNGQGLVCQRPAHDVRPGQEVMVMLRAERFLLGEEAKALPESLLVGSVSERLYLGKSIEYVVALPEYERPLTVIDNRQHAAVLPVGAAIDIAVLPAYARLLANE